jgi:hypothetical protein
LKRIFFFTAKNKYKNAGFACFGSISEIIDDLKASEEEVDSVSSRVDGLQLLEKIRRQCH